MKITNERFTIRFCTIADNYGFKTVGKFEQFLRNLKSPSMKLWVGGDNTWYRATYLIKEIETFKTNI